MGMPYAPYLHRHGNTMHGSTITHALWIMPRITCAGLIAVVSTDGDEVK